MKNLFALLILFLVILLFYFLYEQKNINIIIEFDKLRPVFNKLDIFYNGFKIGRSKKVYPCHNSRAVCILCSIDNTKMFLPENISAKLKIKRVHEKNNIEFIDLIYPDNPSEYSLKNETYIKGTTSVGIQNYLHEEVDYSEIEQIKFSILNASKNLESSTYVLLEILNSINNMTKKSENNLINSSYYANSTLKNLNSSASKINNSINEKQLINILNNFEYITDDAHFGLKTFLSNFDLKTNSEYITSIVKNADEIITGINCDLNKPFGFFRVLFGKQSP